MKKTTIAFVSLCVAAAAFAAAAGCGSTDVGGAGSSSSGAGGAGPSEYEAYCQAAFDRDVKCGNMTTPTQIAECLLQESCDKNFLRPSVGAPLRACYVARDCMTSDDTCVTAASDAQPDSASSTAYGKACTDKLAACTTAGTPFADDSCFNYKLVQDGVLDQMTPCFAGPCDMVNACVLAVIATIYDPCGEMK